MNKPKTIDMSENFLAELPVRNSQPIMLLDISVLAHTIAFRFSKDNASKIKYLRPYCHAAIHRLAESHVFQTSSGYPVELAGIIGCEDIKHFGGGYWRNDYLKEVYGFAGYKGGRTNSYQDILSNVKEYLVEACVKVGASMGNIGYEADDIAAYLVQALPPEQRIVLATVDGDWLGLLEEGRSCWLGVSNCKLRYVSRIAELQVKLGDKTPYTTAEQVWTRKAIYGDPSDKLKAGSPLEVIHLFQPPPEYNLLKILGKQPALELLETAKKNRANCNFAGAANWLKQNQLWPAPQAVRATVDCPMLNKN